MGGDTGVSFGGYDAERRPFVFLEFLFGSLGRPPDQGRRRRVQQLGGQLLEQPDRGHRVRVPAADRALRLSSPTPAVPASSGAASRWCDSTASWRRRAPCQLRTDRQKPVPYGLAGGRPGTPSRNVLNPDGPGEQELPAKCTLTVRHGDVLPPRAGRRGRLGRSARARSGAGAARRAGGEDHRRLRAARVRSGDRRADRRGRAGGDRAAARGEESLRCGTPSGATARWRR